MDRRLRKRGMPAYVALILTGLTPGCVLFGHLTQVVSDALDATQESLAALALGVNELATVLNLILV